jgi:hypothetical protein
MAAVTAAVMVVVTILRAVDTAAIMVVVTILRAVDTGITAPALI